ncbi:MAG TPA: PAS domain S-box protein, partial [Terriglobales bacterium]|nr:PAS domain S-box protein [Terriglobales bacterium]
MTQDQVNILMVDDQPGKLLSYEAILNDLGENLIKATSGREALEHLLKNDIAVVLMDVSMPELDGFQLAEMIRQHPRFQKTAIIFISAVHLSDVDRMKGYERGAVDYISVPVIPELLRAKVSVFAELHRKRHQLEHLNRQLEQRVQERTRELEESQSQILRLNRELKQRVTELETIMQVLPVGVAVAHDPECKVITANATLTQIIGTRFGENVSKSTVSTLPYEVYKDGKRVPPELLPMQRAASLGQPVAGDVVELRYENGTVLHMVISANPLFDEEGNIRGAVGAHVDITQRVQMEQTLRERAELLELASEAIIVCDERWNVRYWNAGAEALYGWTREEAMGQNLRHLLKSQWEVPAEKVEAALATEGRWDGNIIHRTKDGREIVVASRQAAKRNGDPGVLEINRDITTQMQAEEALR